MIYYISILTCLLGIYKSWKGFRGCIKASAIKPAFDMLFIILLFIIMLVITLYVVKNYNIEEKYNLKPTTIIEYD